MRCAVCISRRKYHQWDSARLASTSKKIKAAHGHTAMRRSLARLRVDGERETRPRARVQYRMRAAISYPPPSQIQFFGWFGWAWAWAPLPRVHTVTVPSVLLLLLLLMPDDFASEKHELVGEREHHHVRKDRCHIAHHTGIYRFRSAEPLPKRLDLVLILLVFWPTQFFQGCGLLRDPTDQRRRAAPLSHKPGI